MKIRHLYLSVTFLIGFVIAVSTTTFALTKTPVETGTPKYGGVLRHLQIAGPGGYDLHARPSWAGYPMRPIFSNLVTFNPEYYDVTIENVIGELADRFTISEDSLTYTFYLRKDVKWHDGMPFTADDVVHSIEKMMSPATGSRISRYFPEYESIKKIDTYTVQIQTKYSSPCFLTNLAGPYAIIQAKHNAGTDPKSLDFLVGTGPFKFKTTVPGSYWEVERFDDYFKKDKAGRQLPYLDGLKLFFIKGDYLDPFLGRRTDILQGVDNKEKLDRVLNAAPELKSRLNAKNVPYMIYLNMRYKPFQDMRVRRALSLIYNQDDQMKARFGAVEMGYYGGLFDDTWGIPADEVNRLMRWDRPYSERVKEAQELMAQAGYPNGFKVRMLYGSYPGGHSEKSFSIFGDKLKRYLNIEYELRGMNYGEMYKVRAKGEWEMVNEVIYALLPDPNVYKPYFQTGTRANFAGYSNPALDVLWEAQGRELDFSKRHEMVQEIERIILKDRVIFPGAFMKGTRFWYPYVKNYRANGMIYGLDAKLEDVWIDN